MMGLEPTESLQLAVGRGGLAKVGVRALSVSNSSSGGNTGSSGFSSRTEYEVDAAGRFLLNVRVGDAATSPITIMQNWDLLTKR